MRLLEELKRRNVIRVAIGYLAVSWLLLQAGSLIFGAFDLPNTWTRALLAALGVAFIPTLVFAWVYELTPEGLKRTSDVAPGESVTHLTGRKLDFVVIGVLGAIIALLLVDKFIVTPRRDKGSESISGRQASTRADVRHPENDSDPISATAAPASIAVLPFVDMSQAKDQEYFSDGLSEELLDLLAKVPQLKVIARTSSFSFKGKGVDIAEIAKKLAVASVLEGSVRKSGNTLRVTAQLIRTSDSTHLWSETYDRELTDIFKVQDEIAGAVVSALKLKLLPNQPLAGNAHHTESIEAYNLYLHGKEFYNRTNLDGWRRADAAYRQALALDPNYAAAWAGLARTLTFTSDFAEDSPAVAAAKHDALAAAEKAIALAPEQPDGYEARAFLRIGSLWDWAGAGADVDRVLALDPGSVTALRDRGLLSASLGRLPEATAAIRKAVELDPLYDGNWVDLAQYLLASRKIEEAHKAAERAVALNPESSFAVANLGTVELIGGKPEAAQAAFKRASETLWVHFGTALSEHTLGHEPASQAALDALVREAAQGAAYQIAEVHTWRGEHDQAFEWLNRAYDQRDGGLCYVKFDPLLDALRGDPRYLALLTKLNLPVD